MNDNNNLELFYIVPYTKSYNSGGYYRSDETCSTTYRAPSESIWNGDPLFFDEKEQLLNWFYQNAGNPIPNVYRIRYIANYQGVEDVFKITNLEDGKIEYYTALSENYYAKYDEDMSKRSGKIVWKPLYSHKYDDKASLRFVYIYDEFIKRGIKIRFNVYEKSFDERIRFEFIGDPLYEKEKAAGKKLVLYRPSYKGFW